MVLVDPQANAKIPCGYISIGGAVVLIVVGYIVMQKMATIEV
jgi:hypothetical protein